MQNMYFNHSYSLRNQTEILELRAEFGINGYGLYLMLLETIAESETESINQKFLGGLAINLGTDKKTLENIVKYCIYLELFVEKNSQISSNYLSEHFNKRKEIRDKRRLAGQKGGVASAKQKLASAKQKLASAKQVLSNEEANGKQIQPKVKKSKINQSKIKEIKEKESKEKKPIQKIQEIRDQKVTKKNFSLITEMKNKLGNEKMINDKTVPSEALKLYGKEYDWEIEKLDPEETDKLNKFFDYNNGKAIKLIDIFEKAGDRHTYLNQYKCKAKAFYIWQFKHNRV